MKNNKFLVKSFGMFFRYKPGRLIFQFIISLFLGFTQGLSIALLIPLLGLLTPNGSPSSNTFINFIETFFNKSGVGLNLKLVLIVYAVALAIIALLNYAQSIMQSSYQQGFSFSLRQRLFKKILNSDWEFLNGNSKHNHIQILTNEIPKVTTYYYFYLNMASKAIFALSHVIVAMMVSFEFTIFILIIGFLIFIALHKNINRSEKLGDETVSSFRKMLKHIDDFWSTVKIAKVHNSEIFYMEQFNIANERILKNQLEHTKNRSFPTLIFSVTGIFILIIIVYFSYSVIGIPVQNIFVLILLFSRIYPQFSQINNDMNMLVANSKSTRMVLDLDKNITYNDFNTTEDISPISFNSGIDLKNIDFSYLNENPLFTNFYAFFPAHKITGIIGKTGCGKTTLLDIITGLLKTQKGSIMVDGIELNETNYKKWRKKISYLPQESFFIDATIRTNLIWDSSSNFSDEQIYKTLKMVDAYDVVMKQKDGLDTYISNYQYHFSGGERQRLSLARALIRTPKLLLLDEATSALDSFTEATIMDSLVLLKNNVTIIFVTHRLNLIKYFDKVITLDSKTDTI
ncbi:MAG: ABC transporter ATP-binding protein/permease [Bacteroidales bacterium]|nr:ABC transporter ATP-binding protein/permease [Bacteroidales bacterium]